MKNNQLLSAQINRNDTSEDTAFIQIKWIVETFAASAAVASLYLSFSTADASRCCRRARMDPDLEVEVGDILDNSAAKHKLAIRPRRNYADPRARGGPGADSGSSDLQR